MATKDELKQKLQELKHYLTEIQDQIDSMRLMSYSNKMQAKFLSDHVSMYKGKLCLYKRVDYRWMVNLLKKGVIRMCKEDGVYYLSSELDLAQEYDRRIKRKWRVYYAKEHASDFFDSPPDAQLYDHHGSRVEHIFHHRANVISEYWELESQLQEMK